MATVFNAAEIIDMGIEKERRRRDFYAHVSKAFADKDLVKLFTDLTAWEEEHIRKFSQIRDSVKETEIAESYQGEFTAYIRALVDDKLYAQVTAEDFARNVRTPFEAIGWGISFEKDAILFFNELAEFMPSENKGKVRQLVEEEKRHIVYLSELRKKFVPR